MKRNTQKVIIEAEVPRSLTEVGVDAVDAAIKAATPYLEQAREAGSHRVTEAQTRLAPLAEQARERFSPLAEQARERIVPLAEQAKDRIAPFAEQAKERAGQAQDFLAPYVADAQTRLVPVAHEAKIRSAAGARGTLDNLAPRLEHALLAVGPLAEEAATRLHDDVVPRAAKFLDAAAEVEPTKGRRGRKGGKAWKVLLVLAGLLGLGVLVAKKLATPSQDAWQNYQPTPPAAPRPEPVADAAPAADADVTETAAEDVAAAEPAADAATLADEAETVTESAVDTGYGEGSYIGTDAPAEYPIKGNPRSMKYHVPGSDSFDRTITDVWFATEEAAQAAGFTKATR
ncbi:hypothetical protein GA0111570_101402 [Raineyella antarctica]|uniref:Uncharacterized protein n=1 Tax=Raineyella antarctica TaxID=1577474 RepID=A0A1G6GDR4_9ACTN|nr:DUF5324 family protein [Raineyella antarctica]SDB80127.1 hypothetical protein GA0111570_101402 [Raineyella antarctica]